MKGITDKTKCLASLATFRELYNKQQDIYFIVSEFAKCIIITKSLYSFELEIMHRNLIDENGIDIPRAVVKSALNRLPFLSHEVHIPEHTRSEIRRRSQRLREA